MPKKGRKTRTLEYLAEFFIVMLGIYIAFWLGEQAEKAKNNRLERQYLNDLVEDLTADVELIEYLDILHQSKKVSIQKAVDYFAGKPSNLTTDSIPTFVQEMISLDLFYPDNFTYGSLRQSGDFKLIRSHDIKKDLVQLYSSYESIDKVQNDLMTALNNNFLPEYFKNYDLAKEKITDIRYFESAELSNFMLFALQQMDIISVYFERSKTLADEALVLMNEKLK